MTDRDERLPAVPGGWHTVTPRIVVRDAKGLVAFLGKVFSAAGDYLGERPSEIRIGDSMIMVSDAGERPIMTAFLYVYVHDTDETHRCALAAGAREIEAPSLQFYGDRRSMVEDPWGNTWQIATRPG
jgi:PhnB protein